MSVKTMKAFSGPYVGDGKRRRFEIDFLFQKEGQLQVKRGLPNEMQILRLHQDYAVEVSEKEREIVLLRPLLVGELLTIKRITKITQEQAFSEGGAFAAKSHEEALDKLTLIAQELQQSFEGAVKKEGFQGGAGTLLGFDELGQPESVVLGDGVMKREDFVTIRPHAALLANDEGLNVLYGAGLGIYDNALSVKLGGGLEFDAQFKMQVQQFLLELIEKMQGQLIDLESFIVNITNRVVALEGGDVSIQIGNGLKFDVDGKLTVRPHTGIDVSPSGISVRIGEGLEVDVNGDIKISERLKEKIARKAEIEDLIKKADKTELPKAQDFAGSGLEVKNGKLHITKEKRLAIIYPNGGTEEAPAEIVANNRYIEENPFPGREVQCEVEVFYNGLWGALSYGTGGISGVTQTIGAKAYLFNGTIVVQTAVSWLFGPSSFSGSPFGVVGAIWHKNLPARVRVWVVD